MWPWLRSERFKKSFLLTERQQFLGQLCLFTLAVHIVLLLLCAFWSYRHPEHERFVVSAQKYNTVYVLSPLKKQMKSSARRSGSTSVKASKVIDYGTYQRLKKQKKSESKKKSVSLAAMPIAKETKKSKSFASSQTAKKSINGKKASKATLTITEIVDVVKPQKKVVPEIVKKVEIISEIVKPEIVKEEKVADLKVEEKATLEISQEEAIAESSSLPDELQSLQEDIDDDNVTFIGYEQLDGLAVQNKIQQTIQQNFKSPVGIKKDVSCELSVLVGADGKSKTVTVVRSSGVVVYDTSARAMLYKIEFPKEVWNKIITIALGQ